MGFAVYQIAAFIFTIMVDGDLDLLGLLKFIPWFKYISLMGLILLVLDVAWFWIDRRNNNRVKADLQNENTMLKAKLYDFKKEEKSSHTKI